MSRETKPNPLTTAEVERSSSHSGGRAIIASSRSEKVSKAVARLIAKEVAERKLEPGASLPPELSMAESYGVGRSSIREALRLLENQGLIVIKPGLGGGPIVGKPSADDFGKTMTLFLQILGTPFSQILEAIAPMEGMCAAIAASKCADAGPELFDKYLPERDLAIHAGRLSDEAWIDLSGRFHIGLWDLVGNDVIRLVIGAVGFVFTDRAKFDEHKRWTTKERNQVQAEHIEIAEAVRSGDVNRARDLNEEHYRGIVQAVKKMYPHLANEVIDWH
jgi:DNA-binding FadR family transcriptional regulator